MKFFIYLLGVLCVAVLATADIDDVRRAAIKKLDNDVAEIRQITDQTALEVEKREGNIQIISKHEKEFGEGIIGSTNFQISKTAKSGYMMANLLGSSNDVFRCIESREREALEEASKYYSQKFLDPGRDFELRAEQYQRDLIKSWKNDYYKSLEQYGNIYQKSVVEIKRSTSETTISSYVRDFEKLTVRMANIIRSIFPNLAETHIQVLRVFTELVSSLQKYGKYRVEETEKAIQKCFPKLYEPETLSKNFFDLNGNFE